VAHPGELAVIYKSKKKNDRRDAEKLAKMLLLKLVPTVHVPPKEVRTWRQSIGFRRKLIQKRTAIKNQVRGLLRSIGVDAPAGASLWTQAGLRWLKELEFEHRSHARQRDALVAEIELSQQSLRGMEEDLKQTSRENFAVQQLQSIPGVGQRTAEAVVAHLDDPQRFSSGKQVAAYFGLVPRQDQSGGVNRLGHITKDGPPCVRQLLTEAVWQAIRRSPTIRAYYERIRRGDPDRKKIAVVATSSYLARVMWAMLKDGTLWRETVEETIAA
jgi:transposase